MGLLNKISPPIKVKKRPPKYFHKISQYCTDDCEEFNIQNHKLIPCPVTFSSFLMNLYLRGKFQN